MNSRLSAETRTENSNILAQYNAQLAGIFGTDINITCAMLKERLRALNLPVSGRKHDLLAVRFANFLATNGSNSDPPSLGQRISLLMIVTWVRIRERKTNEAS